MGNESFKNSRNVTPQEFTRGTKGEQADFFIELEIIADAGFIGFPNIGKSTLLNELTRARAKVKDYPFTTLDPNLGDFYGFILADIPGLIEGAASGKGLGHKFLRHIKRTQLLIHCISLDFDLTDVRRPSEILVERYKIIREELRQFDVSLTKKPEIIVLTKSDLTDEKEIKKIITELKKLNPTRDKKLKTSAISNGVNPEIIATSAYDDNSIKKFSDFLSQKLKKLAIA